MSKPCKFPSLDGCQKRFLRTHKETDLAPHPVVGLVLQVGDAEKFPRALGFESLAQFFRSSKQGPCFTAIEVTRRLVELELACKADGIASPNPVQSGHCCHCVGSSSLNFQVKTGVRQGCVMSAVFFFNLVIRLDDAMHNRRPAKRDQMNTL